MKKLLLWLGKCLVAGICTIIILSVFCFVFLYEGTHVTEETGATDYTWESNQWKATMSEGFAWLKMDENGYNNAFIDDDEIDILLMGSSHMEALQVDADENTGYLLNKMIPRYTTYNIGISGHTIYRCIDNMNDAVKNYAPNKYVVLVIDTVDLNELEMKNIITETAKPIPSYDSGMMYYIQKIPAAKAVYKQLDEWVSLESLQKPSVEKGDSKEPSQDRKEDNTLTSDYINLLNAFLSKAITPVKEIGGNLIIVFQPQQALTGEGAVEYYYSEDNLKFFKQACKEKGIVFCDMTEAFNELFEKEHQLAHGFVNSELGEGHLNKYGHKILAEYIAAKIEELEAIENDIN